MGEKDKGILYRETKRFTRLMMVELDMFEIRRLKDRLPELQGELVSKELEKKRAMAEFDKAIKTIRGNVELTTREILRGEGERSITLFWRLFDDTCKKQLIKEETGEVVDEKFMEDHEKQRKFSFVEPGDRTGDLEEAEEGDGLTETDEKARQVYTEEVGQFNAPRIARPTFEPLPEPFGACELCQGYGTISGELYGETCLVPCTCVAGEKVAAVKATAEQIAAEAPEVDPCVECDADKVKENGGDCKQCPDYPENRRAAGVDDEVEESFPFAADPTDSPAIRRGISQSDEPDAPLCPGVRACPEYLDFREKNGPPDTTAVVEVGVPCYSCGSLRLAGCTGCSLRFVCDATPDPHGDCREVTRAGLNTSDPAPSEPVAAVLETTAGCSEGAGGSEQSQAVNRDDMAADGVTVGMVLDKEAEQAPQGPTELQKKCPHPKPFQKIIPGVGEVCGVCELVTEPEAVAAAAPAAGTLPFVDDDDSFPDPPKPKFKDPSECEHPQARQHLAGDAVTCGMCGTILRTLGKEEGGKAPGGKGRGKATPPA